MVSLISHAASSVATLTWLRQDNEQILDFAQILGNPVVTSTVDGILAGTNANRTSGLTAQGMFWKDVPYDHHDAGRHQPWDMLVRVYFNVHVHTPWYCTDADATLSYYLLFWLDDGGLLNGSADYTTWRFSGACCVCEGGVNDDIRKALQNGFPTVQSIIDGAISQLASGTYSMLYFLPGDGTRTSGDSTQDADHDVALALIPTTEG